MTPSIVYAHVRAEQDRSRRDHRTAHERRRARERCEDLTEHLGRMALPPRDPDQAADLLRRTAGRGPRDRIARHRAAPDATAATTAADHSQPCIASTWSSRSLTRPSADDWITPDARSLALDLAAVLVARVEAQGRRPLFVPLLPIPLSPNRSHPCRRMSPPGLAYIDEAVLPIRRQCKE